MVDNLLYSYCSSCFLLSSKAILYKPRTFLKKFNSNNNIITISLHYTFFFLTSYYPLHPHSEDVNLDYEQFAKYALFPCSPDILILPSDLRYFTKVNTYIPGTFDCGGGGVDFCLGFYFAGTHAAKKMRGLPIVNVMQCFKLNLLSLFNLLVFTF